MSSSMRQRAVGGLGDARLELGQLGVEKRITLASVWRWMNSSTCGGLLRLVPCMAR